MGRSEYEDPLSVRSGNRAQTVQNPPGNQFLVAKYEEKRVLRANEAFHNDKQTKKNRPWSFCLAAMTRLDCINATKWPLAIFLFVYFLFRIVYHKLLHYSKETTCPEAALNTGCTVAFSKEGFETFVTQISEQHDSIDEVIALLLGFYVEIMMTRWWEQLTSLPSVEDLAITLNSLVESKSGNVNALELKKKILRFSLLSFVLRMTAVSPLLRKHFDNEDAFIEKNLADYEEMRLLRSENNSQLGRHDRWWVPINWCCAEIRKASGPGMLIPKSSKEIVKSLIQFKKDLGMAAKPVLYPIPALASKAVHFTLWIFLVFGAIAVQPLNDGDNDGAVGNHNNHGDNVAGGSGFAVVSDLWWIFEDIPLYSCCLIVILFSWLKMARICKNSFGGDSDDNNNDAVVNMLDELDRSIWAASVALQSLDSR